MKINSHVDRKKAVKFVEELAASHDGKDGQKSKVMKVGRMEK